MEYTELEKIVNPDDGEGGWVLDTQIDTHTIMLDTHTITSSLHSQVDTHPNSDILIEGSGTAEMSSEEKVLLLFPYLVFSQ